MYTFSLSEYHPADMTKIYEIEDKRIGILFFGLHMKHGRNVMFSNIMSDNFLQFVKNNDIVLLHDDKINKKHKELVQELKDKLKIKKIGTIGISRYMRNNMNRKQYLSFCYQIYKSLLNDTDIKQTDDIST